MRLLLALAFFLISPARAADYTLSSQIYAGETVPFLEHHGSGAFDTYLTMNLPFGPVEQLYREIQRNEGVRLISRGEAHITVVTPIEYWNVLRTVGITAGEINQIALDHGIQGADFSVLCLGRGELLIDGRSESSYFLVVRAEKLVEIRRAIHELFVARGGSGALFNPSHFYPHVTIGYTARDLHEADGVIKDERSCVGRVHLRAN